MKRTLTILTIALFTTTLPNVLSAQTQKGSWLVEGSIGNIQLSNDKTKGDSPFINKSNTFEIALVPVAGYFITENIVVGISLNLLYSYSHLRTYGENDSLAGSGRSNRRSIGLDPFIRYYFTRNSKNRWYAQLQGGPSFQFQTDKSTDLDGYGNTIAYKTDYNSKGYSAAAFIGLNHFFTENLALNLSLGYGYSNQTNTSHFTYTGSSNNDDKNHLKEGSLQWNMGFSIFLNRKK